MLYIKVMRTINLSIFLEIVLIRYGFQNAIYKYCEYITLVLFRRMLYIKIMCIILQLSKKLY